MDTTWIKLHRKISKHWIFKDAERFKAWVTILIEVNHAPQKVLIGSTLFNVKRGESVKSIHTWAKLFGWDDSKVRRFFELLKTDEMIDSKSESITTRITVLNYNSYQTNQRINEEQMTSKRLVNDEQATTNKKEKNVNNEKKEEEKKVFAPPEFSELGEYFIERAKKEFGDSLDIPAIKNETKLYFDIRTNNKWIKANGKKVKNWKNDCGTWILSKRKNLIVYNKYSDPKQSISA